MAVKTSQVLNTIRANASAEYQARIPAATQTTIGKIGEMILNYPTQRNEFITALTNQVVKTVFYTKSLENKFKFINKGKLEFGRSIEQVFSDVVAGKTYTPKTGTESADLMFGKAEPNTKVNYIDNYYANYYTITFTDDQLRGAFRVETGFNSMVNSIVQSALNSAEYDEFLIHKQMIENGKYKKVVSVAPTNEANAKTFTVDMKELIDLMSMPSKDYNQAGVTTQTKASELVVFITSKAKAQLDVELLATAFNMDKAELNLRLITVGKFDDANRIAVVCDEEYIQHWYTTDAVENVRNSINLSTNMIIHKRGVVGTTPFLNAVEISTQA